VNSSQTVSFPARLRQLAVDRPDDVAMVFVALDGAETPVSYRELDDRSSQVAALLRERGLDQGDLVVVSLPNRPENAFAVIGAWKLGATVLPLRWDLPTWERDRLLEVAGPRLTIGNWVGADGVTSAMLASTATHPVLELPDRVARPSHGIASSGSTGLPKIILAGRASEGVVGAQRPLAAQLADLPAERTVLIPAPLYHANGFVAMLLGLFEAERMVIMAKFEAELAVQLLEKWRVTYFTAVPTMLGRMLRVPRIEKRDLSTLQCVMQGGASVPPWVVEGWAELVGPTAFWMSYGSTEAIGFAVIRADDWLEHRGSVGRGRNTEIRILGSKGEHLPPGEIGDIYMRLVGPAAKPFEYQGAAPPPRTDDGFTSVGDVGWLDEDGYLFIADRRVDMIVTGGANVFPAEVEAALSEHEGVADVVVIGLPDPAWGHRVHAIVAATQPAASSPEPPLTDAELIAYAKERLAAYKVPKTIEFVDRMPRSDAGKLNRNTLVKERTAQTERS
jgi:bile acid-coenzyme A ligase